MQQHNFKIPGSDKKPKPEAQGSWPDTILPMPQPDAMRGGSPMKLKRASTSRRKLLLWSIVALVTLLLLGFAVAVSWFYNMLGAPNGETQQKRVTIAQGASLAQMATELEQEGVIKSSTAFQLYIRLRGLQSRMQAGTYVLSSSQTTQEVAADISDGRVDSLTVTILPGQTLNEITDTLVEYGYSKESVQRALAAEYTHSLLATKPAGASLEGYIFPDTYSLAANDNVEDLLTLSFDAFDARIKQAGIDEALARQNLNLHQGITLGSIIQKEVSNEADQRQVAQVFLKRLRDNIELGSDVTFIYAAQQMGVEPRVDLDSPYNTRRYKGLPPGPIANFNISALEAVARPAPGDFVFFVADREGQTYFARTLEEHEANVRRYCTEHCDEF